MSNYTVVYDISLSNLQKEADKLVSKGYVPSGGITTFAHDNSFHTDSEVFVDFNSETRDMKVKFLQAFYKPQTSSI